MNRETPLPPEVWERTPPEAQAYIRVLEARVMALEATVQHLEAIVQQLREQLQQDSRPNDPDHLEPHGTDGGCSMDVSWTFHGSLHDEKSRQKDTPIRQHPTVVRAEGVATT